MAVLLLQGTRLGYCCRVLPLFFLWTNTVLFQVVLYAAVLEPAAHTHLKCHQFFILFWQPLPRLASTTPHRRAASCRGLPKYTCQEPNPSHHLRKDFTMLAVDYT